MKTLAIYLLAFSLVGTGLSLLKLTEEERKMAIDHLTETKENTMDLVEDLSDEQLNFKPSEDAWSIAECVEHLAISEHAFAERLQGSLQVMADASRRGEVKMTDGQLLGLITDRSQKVQTSPSFEPGGKFGDFEETLEAFEQKREEHIDYVKNTEDDLRNHYGQLPFGTVDAYQMILFMSGHTERHNQQIEEIMEHPDFPEGDEDDEDYR